MFHNERNRFKIYPTFAQQYGLDLANKMKTKPEEHTLVECKKNLENNTNSGIKRNVTVRITFIVNLQCNLYNFYFKTVPSTSGIRGEKRHLSDDLLTSNANWSDSMTRLLISVRLEMEEEFWKPIAKNKLWVKVSDHLAIKGYKVSSTECDKKWRNLLSTYRRNKDKVKNKTGEGAITWPYFDLFNAAIGCRSDVTPSPETLMSSLPEKNYSASSSTPSPPPVELSSTSSSSTSSLPQCSLENFKKARKRKANKPPLWFSRYLEKLKRLRKRETKEKTNGGKNLKKLKKKDYNKKEKMKKKEGK
ncbi:uncharacterized protein [Centruroides vittatus]|uniref:uncharacterized protein isoform X2 n=1 Tax=Centruroides vittatus TaxID=120091 RepID=UPI00350FD8CF